MTTIAHGHNDQRANVKLRHTFNYYYAIYHGVNQKVRNIMITAQKEMRALPATSLPPLCRKVETVVGQSLSYRDIPLP